MITLEKAKEIYPKAFEGLSDEESQKALDDLHGLADLAFDMWIKKKKIGQSPIKD